MFDKVAKMIAQQAVRSTAKARRRKNDESC
jgi:hypothetical protein